MAWLVTIMCAHLCVITIESASRVSSALQRQQDYKGVCYMGIAVAVKVLVLQSIMANSFTLIKDNVQ